MTAARLYIVTCQEAAMGHLIVRSDSHEGAASFLQTLLIDQERLSLGEKATYYVAVQNEDLGDGIWLSGYDSSDDLETLLQLGPNSWDPGKTLLWSDDREIVL